MSKSTHRNSKKKSQPQKKYPLGYLLPLIMFLAAIPLFMRQYHFRTGLTQYDWFQGADKTSDMFLHVKMVWSYAMFIIILCILIYMVGLLYYLHCSLLTGIILLSESMNNLNRFGCIWDMCYWSIMHFLFFARRQQ